MTASAGAAFPGVVVGGRAMKSGGMNTASSALLVPPPRGDGVVFVTGAGGFIGRHAASAFQAAGWTVVGFGPPAPEDDVPNLRGPAHQVEAAVGIDGLAAAARQFGLPEAIVHAAGAASVGASLADPGRDFDRNLGSVRQVLDFMRGAAPKARLVFLSSAAVYGADHEGPITEDDTLNPISPYGLHKRLAEQLVEGWARLYGLEACVVRLFSVYGPGLRKQLLWDVADRLLAGANPLPLSGSGLELRDYIHVDDAVRLIGCVLSAEGAPPVIVNGGGGAPSSVAEVAEAFCRAAGGGVRPLFDGVVRPGDPRSLVAEISRARDLGFEPRRTLSEGVAEFYRWAQAATR